MTPAVPRDRAGTFDPKLIAKYQRRFPDFDDKIVSMYARGMTVREIRGHLEELCGIEVSPELISSITDPVLETVAEWQGRPLDGCFPLVFFDAIRVKIRDEGFVRNKAVYIALGIQPDGTKEILRIWIEQTEGAKFWLRVMRADRVDFLFGLARNERLEAAIRDELTQAALDSLRTGYPARRFKDFMWSTLGSWSRNRRVIGKAEVTRGEANPRFVVTSLKSREAAAQHLYEVIYCARGEMENRIKECQLELFADRTSAATRCDGAHRAARKPWRRTTGGADWRASACHIHNSPRQPAAPFASNC